MLNLLLQFAELYPWHLTYFVGKVLFSYRKEPQRAWLYARVPGNYIETKNTLNVWILPNITRLSAGVE